MAFLSLTPPLITTNTSISSPSIRNPCPAKRRHPGFVRKRFACKASATSEGSRQDNQQKNPTKINNASAGSKFDRRDMLIGLGGLYGVAGLSANPFASAAPVEAPDLTKCHRLLAGPEDLDPKCCPPFPKYVDFKLPERTRLRYRLPAHDLDPEYIAKFEKAVEIMKSLPDDDPRSFTQQAKVHCAYCNGAYDQVGFPSQYIQIHKSWLFFPFHRWYFYFYERILGKLINDPTFALPFWNWDAPCGYQIPSIFVDPSSSLYDQNRNQGHLPPALVDLDYTNKEVDNPGPPVSEAEQIATNNAVMYTNMVSCAKTPCLFFGQPYRTGSAPEPGDGSIERTCHTAIHIWCGDNRRNNGEDMGNFYSAGNDPLFYSHHANIDRMWNIWKSFPGPTRVDISEPDYLNSSFFFYDENAQLVRVKVKDSLDSRKLGYVYEDVDIPWLHAKPSPAKSKIIRSLSENRLTQPIEFPITLDKTVSTLVKRPRKARSKLEKEAEEEVLVVQGIAFNKGVPVKFDVYVNDEDDQAPCRPYHTEFAGSFASVPEWAHNGMTTLPSTKTTLHIGISELLEDLDADDDESVVVTLVPRSGVGKVKIDEIKIELESCLI